MRRLGAKYRKSRRFRRVAVRHDGKWETFPKQQGRSGDQWVAIAPGFVYMSLRRRRAYWLLWDYPPERRPRLTFSEHSNTVGLNAYRIRFERTQDFNYARTCLAPFSRRAAEG